uniref:Cathepsin L14 n=1 Tax=Zabrotes subfasciatus TaxID=122865 RepID=A0A8K1XWG4_ZABSU|nr:cathepsin L14 [Zabrotes subfasciatus]
MKYLVHFLLCLLILKPASTDDYDDYPETESEEDLNKAWIQFKARYNKTYSDHHDSSKRKAWEENLEKVKKHNEEADQGIHSYYIRANHLSDMNTQTYLQKMVKLTKSTHRKVDPDFVGDIYERLMHLPEEMSWIEKGFRTPAYNQRDCGSCYAFSIANAIQGQIFKQTERLIPLSEQQIVDCSISYGNFGCAGGSLRNTLRYLERTGGLMTYDDYPYAFKQQRCHFDRRRAIVNITSWAVLPARDERALEAAVAKIGPIAASINASPHTFQLYHKGIYDDLSCTSNHVNHAMLIVGYTKNAWILKNWWGKHWGENGYMRLRRNVNRCGIANYAAYALV